MNRIVFVDGLDISVDGEDNYIRRSKVTKIAIGAISKSLSTH
jgi:hypothetical protein